jgi:sulfite reductase (NADPH) flavoprotein alpha-component
MASSSHKTSSCEKSSVSYTRKNPYLAEITERYLINKPGSKKETYHLVFNIQGSGIEYKPGDCFGIIPYNDPVIVDKVLSLLGATGDEEVMVTRKQETYLLREFLFSYANISRITKKFVEKMYSLQKDKKKKAVLEVLLGDGEVLKKYIETHELCDFLAENEGVLLPLSFLADHARMLTPRLYSVASAMSAVGEELHLTIGLVTYDTNDVKRYGVATRFLCHNALLHKKNIKIFPHHCCNFALPSDDTKPIIMIGPGTGIAPFRGFMQERIAAEAKGKNWLFFGDWTRAHDFLYDEYWNGLKEEGLLRLSLAFSRDQDYKIYVQDKVRENASDMWKWLEEGAYFYVCGDAKRMAKDVDKALRDIIQQEGGLSEEAAGKYVKKMRHDKRYLCDVY